MRRAVCGWGRGRAWLAHNRQLQSSAARPQNAQAEAYYEEDQVAMQQTARRIIDTDINPHVEEWEATGSYPAKQVGRTRVSDTVLMVLFRRCSASWGRPDCWA